MLKDEMKEWIESHSDAKVERVTLGESPRIWVHGRIPHKVLKAFEKIFGFSGKGHFVTYEGAFHSHYDFIYKGGNYGK